MHGSGYSLKKNRVGRQIGNFFYTSGIYAEGYIFRSFVILLR